MFSWRRATVPIKFEFIVSVAFLLNIRLIENSWSRQDDTLHAKPSIRFAKGLRVSEYCRSAAAKWFVQARHFYLFTRAREVDGLRERPFWIWYLPTSGRGLGQSGSLRVRKTDVKQNKNVYTYGIYWGFERVLKPATIARRPVYII